MKKIHLGSLLAGIIAAALFFSLVNPAGAEQTPVTFNGINLRVNDRDIAKEGESLTLGNGASVPYSIGYNGTNYVPIGKLADLFGIGVSWDGAKRVVTLDDNPDGWGSPVCSVGEWSVYHNTSYTVFNMVHFKNGKADAVYTMPGSRPAAMPVHFVTATEYKDANDGGRVYAVLFAAPGVRVSFPFSERLIYELTNAFRGLHGTEPLKWNDTLAGAARSHSQDMHDNTYVAHTNKRGEEAADRAAAAGYQYRALGENITAGYGDAVGVLHALIESPDHRKNIISDGFTEMGVGNVSGSGGYRYYSTQLYAAPS